MPVYNVEPYLKQCIDSITRQTYHNLQIILLDDGSTDNSGKICDTCASQNTNITVIHQNNGGLSDARNTGLAHASGKYVYFLDSDDFIEPQTIEILTSIAEQNRLDVINFDGKAAPENDCPYLESDSFWTASGSYPDVMKGHELLKELITHHDYKAPVQTYLYNRDFLIRNSLTFMKGIIHEDELFSFAVLMTAGRAMHIPVSLFHHRLRNSSIMSSGLTQKNSDSMYLILNDALKTYRHFHDNPETRQAYEAGTNHLARTYFWRYLRTIDIQDSRGRQQFYAMMKELSAAGCTNASRFERRIRLHKLDALRASLSKITPLRAAYRLARRTAGKTVRHFRPRIDDECRDILATLARTNNNSARRIIILCVPRHGNRGDIAIALAERRLLKTHCKDFTIIELPGDLCASYSRLAAKHINSRDILMMTGGGFFGSLWRNEELSALNIMRRFPDNKTLILPQTVFYAPTQQGRRELDEDRRAFSRFTDLHVFVRDRNSYELINRENLFPNAKSVNHVPDMVCSMDFTALQKGERSGVLVCLRPDIEKVFSDEQRNELYLRLVREYPRVGFYSTHPVQCPAKIKDWESALTESLTRVAGAELLVTDRLHGMIFAAVTGTPCVAFDNASGKVHSVHEWLKNCGYIQVCGSFDDFGDAARKALNSPAMWDNSELMPYFQEIIRAVKE